LIVRSVYEKAMQGSVVSIFGRNLAPNGFVLLADPGRQQSIDLLAGLEHEGACFDLEIAHVEPTCGLGSGALVEVVLLKGEFKNGRLEIWRLLCRSGGVWARALALRPQFEVTNGQ
jgi:hypothetical protein